MSALTTLRQITRLGGRDVLGGGYLGLFAASQKQDAFGRLQALRHRTSIHKLARKPQTRVDLRPEKPRAPSLDGNPQKEGVITKVFIQSPKKPNSANRKACKVLLSNGKLVNAKIDGEGHNLFEHSTVLLRGGRSRDLIGFRYKVIRGARDSKGVVNRKTSRSKYGAKRPKS
mmetsp:Transcript_5968/g.17976  ORF Transcript_5968/g.17976 Transcript_5968/m.17976 type:complete len:172 (+) Transcript_5968:56-571(+)